MVKREFWCGQLWFGLADLRISQTRCLIGFKIYFEYWLFMIFDNAPFEWPLQFYGKLWLKKEEPFQNELLLCYPFSTHMYILCLKLTEQNEFPTSWYILKSISWVQSVDFVLEPT